MPAAQLAHDGAPLVLNVPAAQERHAALDVPPMLGLCVPAAQRKHVGALLVLYEPAAHGVHAAVAPAATDVP